MATENPRPEKVAVVQEVRERLTATEAAVLTEYRGLDVPAMATLRAAIRQAGGEYKIYKNTLVRFAAAELGLDIEDLLVGPTAIAFVAERPDGSAGDPASLAKALRDFAKDNENLVIKGGVLDDQPLSLDEITALADLPSRDQLYAEFAGAMESMYQDFAGLLDAKLREFAYALEEFLDKGGPQGGDGEPAPAAEPTETEAATSDDAATETETVASDDSATETETEAAASDDAATDDAEDSAEATTATEASAESAPEAAEGGEEAVAEEPEAVQASTDGGDNESAGDGESEES